MIEQTQSATMMPGKSIRQARPLTVEILMATALALVACVSVYLTFFEGRIGL